MCVRASQYPLCGGFMEIFYTLTFMLLSILLFILPAAVSYRYLPERVIVPYVYYGSKTNPITYITNFPHHVLIVYGSKYCSGSLIYSKIVVTAASCFTKNNGEAVIVKVGASSLTEIGQLIPVMEYKIHEYFEELGALDNDIALLVLENNVVFGKTVSKTVFVEPEVALRVGAPVLISGWAGTNVPTRYTNALIKAETIVLSKSLCKQLYGNVIKPSNFCVKYTSEQILNDNGGGAVYDETLVGILSMGVAVRADMNVAVVTNVSYFHRWITLNSKRFLTRYCALREDPALPNVQSDET